jgi:hypothetical protein
MKLLISSTFGRPPRWGVCPSIMISARNGPVYAGIPYWNFLSFLNFILALINIYYIHLSFFPIFLTAYPCFAFKNYIGTSKFPFRALIMIIYVVNKKQYGGGTKYSLYFPSDEMVTDDAH